MIVLLVKQEEKKFSTYIFHKKRKENQENLSLKKKRKKFENLRWVEFPRRNNMKNPTLIFFSSKTTKTKIGKAAIICKNKEQTIWKVNGK